MKKSLVLATVMMMSLGSVGSISALAGNNTAANHTEINQEDLQQGTVVNYDVYLMSNVNGKAVETPASELERIAYMKEKGQTPGTEFTIGENKYIVNDDFSVSYIGKGQDKNVAVLNESVTRGANIPTSKGSLPYYGKYSASNYVYSDKYFQVGSVTGYSESIGVTISANKRQQIRVDWMDGILDESMGSKSMVFPQAGDITAFVWVYTGEPFYFKFSNQSSGTISGNFEAFVD